MQGIGNFLAPLITLLLVSTSLNLDLVWRFALGFGAIPPLLTAYHRWKLHKEDHAPPPSVSDNAPALPEEPDRDQAENNEAKPKKRKLVVSWLQNKRYVRFVPPCGALSLIRLVESRLEHSGSTNGYFWEQRALGSCSISLSTRMACLRRPS
jgi:hypothetical protein